MKKLTTLLLSVSLLLALAACGNGGSSSTPESGPSTESQPAVSEPAESEPADDDFTMPEPDAELAALVDAIYEACPVELAMLETMPIDLSDPSYAAWMVGLLDAVPLDAVESGVISTSMINAQAYSLVLLRLKADADMATVGQQLLDNADGDKWVCVWPSAAGISGHEGVVCFVLVDEELVSAESLLDAFAQAAGGEDVRLTLTEIPHGNGMMGGMDLEAPVLG